VSGNYFPTWGLTRGGAGSRGGRRPEAGGSQVAILAYDYWQRRWGAGSTSSAASLRWMDTPLEIVGIAEKGFAGFFNGQRAEGVHSA